MTSRSKLQEKSLDELRTIAEAIEVPDHDSLQKSKLIAAILESDKFDASDAPAPVDLPAIEERRGGDEDGDGRAKGSSDRSGGSGDSDRNRNRFCF